jgi:hypothetical protein
MMKIQLIGWITLFSLAGAVVRVLRHLGLSEQLPLLRKDYEGAGLRWRLRDEHELACRAFDLRRF